MTALDNILKGYIAQQMRLLREERRSAPEQPELFDREDDVVTERLRRILEARALDGTEVHRAIDHELPGLENEITATKIKDAVEQKYRDTIPIDAVTEIVGKLVERTWRTKDNSRASGERAGRFRQNRV